MFTAMVYVLTSGCAWRLLLPSFRMSVPTVHRRFGQWTHAGLCPLLNRAVLDVHKAGLCLLDLDGCLAGVAGRCMSLGEVRLRHVTSRG